MEAPLLTHTGVTGLGQQQQAIQGEHLDMVLLTGQQQDGVQSRGGEDQVLAYQKEQDQGGRD